MTPAEIRTIRLALGLSRRQLAERLGVEPPTIRNWEQVVEKTGKPYRKINGSAVKILESMLFCPDCGRAMHRFHNCEINPTPEGKKHENENRHS